MAKERIFLIAKAEDATVVNAFLEDLERKNEDYDVNYDCEEGYPGIIVIVTWGED